MAGLLALALHLPSLGHGFVRDDVPLIIENALLRGPGGLLRMLSGDFLAATGFTSGLWRPLPLLSFWIEGRLGGWEATLFHATSIALYGGCALLVGRLLMQAKVPWAAALPGALWFAAMPAHVEPVAWISGRTDLLCGFLALLALWLDRRGRGQGRRWPAWGAMAAFAGALLSKEAAAGWVGVVIVAEWTRARSTPTPRREMLRWIAPYAAITVAWLLAHAAAAGVVALPWHLDEGLRARRHAAGWVMLPQYLAFLRPGFPHASDVALWLPGRPVGPAVLAGALATLAAFATAAAWLVRRSRLALPAAMILIPVMPAIAMALTRGFVSSGERMMFLSSAGVAWLAAEALAGAWRRGPGARWAVAAPAAALIVTSAVETVRVQPMWHDDETVFRGMTGRHPRDPVGWVGLGETMMGRGEQAEAERALDRAAGLDPALPSVHMARTELYYRSGDWSRVLVSSARALELDPRSFRARLLRASTLVRVGRPAEAGADIDSMLAQRPGDPGALMVAGQRELGEGRPREAVAPLEAATRANPSDAAPWAALGQALAAAGDLPGARRALEQAVGLAPQAPSLWRRLADVCAALGDSVAARAAASRGQREAGTRGVAAP